MKTVKFAKIILASWVGCFSGIAASAGLSNIGTSISTNADAQVVNGINLPLPFVVSVWSMLSNYYGQNSNFPAAGLYAVDTSVLSGMNYISNTAFGTLDVCYGPTAPGPLASNCYSLAPTRITLRGNTFYVYELVQCFTNITDSLTSRASPQPNTPIGVFGNSNLGTSCLFASDPSSAAVAVVQGSGTSPTQQNGGVSA